MTFLLSADFFSQLVFRNTISIDHLSPYQKVSEYDQEIPQSHTADQPTAR